MKRFRLDGCTALITGASAGLGVEFARQLAQRAGALVLVARREDRLLRLRDELTRFDPNLSVTIRATNLSSASDIDALVRWLKEREVAVDLLINNVGLGDYGPFATCPPERVREIVHVNMMALTQLTRALLPPMIARCRGGILNVSSSAGFLPIPGMALYAATKAFVTSLSEALRLELRGSGIHVTALCPGPVHTEFNTVAQRPGSAPRHAPFFVYVSAEQVVRAALRGLERNRALVIPGLMMKIGMFIVRTTPMPLLRLFGALSSPE